MAPLFTGSKFGFSRNTDIGTTISGDIYYNLVSLLLHMDGVNDSTTFTDSSQNSISITSDNGTKIKTAVSKFGGASGNFTGSSRLNSSYNAQLDLNGTDFTVETWIYPQASGRRIAAAGGGSVSFNSTNGIHWLFQLVVGDYIQVQAYTSGGAVGFTASNTVTLNAWNHVALSISGSNAYLSTNGVVESTNMGFLARPSTNPTLSIGSIPGESIGNGNAFSGYMDDFRITKGVARYTSNFTIPTSAFPDTLQSTSSSSSTDPYFSNVSLLLHTDGTNNSTTFTDSGPLGLSVTAFGDAKITTSQKKFGTGSAVMDGTGDYLSIADNAGFQFGTGDFTIECWLYVTTGQHAFICNGNATFTGSGSTGAIYFALNTDGVGRKVRLGTNTTNPILTGSTIIADNQWYHVALTRSGSTVRIFVNGAVDATASNSQSLNFSNNNLLIGRAGWDTGNFLNGNIDEIRITKGVARYTTAFTVPTEAFPNS